MESEILKSLARLEAKIDRIDQRLNRRDEIEREIRRKYDAECSPLPPRFEPSSEFIPQLESSPLPEDEEDDIFNPVTNSDNSKLKILLVNALLETVQKVESLEKEEIDPSEIICGIYDIIDKQEEDLPVWNFDCLVDCKIKSKMIDRLRSIQAIVGSMTEEELRDPDVFATSVKKGLRGGMMIDGFMGLLTGEGDLDALAKSMGMVEKDNKFLTLIKGFMTPDMKDLMKDAFKSEGSQNMLSSVKSIFSTVSAGNMGNAAEFMNKSILELVEDPRVLGMIKAQISRPPKEEYEREILSLETPPKLTIDTEQQFRMISKIQTKISGYSILIQAGKLGKIYYIFLLIGQKRFEELCKFLQISSLEEFDGKITELFKTM